MANRNAFLDPLYGESVLSDSVDSLACQPVMQRLRQVRLSNIDSVGMPGIANVSRYEHSVGTAILASHVGFRRQLSGSDHGILQAAALLHDSAIPPFGHLVEEAFEYVSAGVNHEARWSLIFGNADAHEPGGLDLQIFLGRQAGLWPWAQRTFGVRADEALMEILETIKGQGRFGKSICGDLDLDNLDNVVRAAFHMGIEVDRSLPRKIAESMIGIEPSRGVIFRASSKGLIQEWLRTRKQVYGRFMLSRPDFIGKLMIIFSTVQAYNRGEFSKQDWVLTDSTFIARLLGAKCKEISEPISGWLSGELWPLSNLVWMKGQSPSYKQVYEFSRVLSDSLSRSCMAYAIKDKRSRALSVELDTGETFKLGATANQWLLGVCSPLRKNFSEAENKRIIDSACKFFLTECIGAADPWGTSETATMSLFQ